jgi:Flp pilus assembly protein TadG
MKRNRRGVTIIEMVVGLMVVIPIVLVIIDFIIMNLAQQINDSAAREADRLAASGDPNQAVSRAQCVLNRINQGVAGYVSQVTLKSVTFNPTTLLATETALVPYGGVVQGSVTVTTTVTVTPAVVCYCCSGPFIFQASQTCPITYNVPNTAGGQVVPP